MKTGKKLHTLWVFEQDQRIKIQFPCEILRSLCPCVEKYYGKIIYFYSLFVVFSF